MDKELMKKASGVMQALRYGLSIQCNACPLKLDCKGPVCMLDNVAADIIKELLSELDATPPGRASEVARLEKELYDARQQISVQQKELAAAISDMEALMWHSGEGCNICYYGKRDVRKPYESWSCREEHGGSECRCKWRGIQKEDQNAS